ncbi:hypothetical protein GZH46_01320 [Fragariocoptes setiger]|uniref:LIM zinc-binding domain-containing protein n=1 Tax=Fragariocoptes setiger TaxID=1670756 RepID=A0ABQ7S9Q1_9ACAR|nr:hypothetical protein GZH46_01320 [Fragariocoptes setiger]
MPEMNINEPLKTMSSDYCQKLLNDAAKVSYSINDEQERSKCEKFYAVDDWDLEQRLVRHRSRKELFDDELDVDSGAEFTSPVPLSMPKGELIEQNSERSLQRTTLGRPESSPSPSPVLASGHESKLSDNTNKSIYFESTNDGEDYYKREVTSTLNPLDGPYQEHTEVVYEEEVTTHIEPIFFDFEEPKAIKASDSGYFEPPKDTYEVEEELVEDDEDTRGWMRQEQPKPIEYIKREPLKQVYYEAKKPGRPELEEEKRMEDPNLFWMKMGPAQYGPPFGSLRRRKAREEEWVGPPCELCHKQIEERRCMLAENMKFHFWHFACSFCMKTLKVNDFLIAQADNKPYCLNCHKRSFPEISLLNMNLDDA